jgi:hypothetical protein
MNKLIFVYNADSDLFSTVTDFAHKIISPKTYACSLCALTFGNFGMKKEWAEFVKTVQPPPDFLHKDEFVKNYGSLVDAEFPAVFTLRSGLPSLLISSSELNACETIAELRDMIARKIL